jgi:hypothetical protein
LGALAHARCATELLVTIESEEEIKVEVRVDAWDEARDFADKSLEIQIFDESGEAFGSDSNVL